MKNNFNQFRIVRYFNKTGINDLTIHSFYELQLVKNLQYSTKQSHNSMPILTTHSMF